jgi:biopolymer transport protein ExbD
MSKIYIGYQNDLPVRVETARDVIENDLFLRCDRIEEYDGRVELIDGVILFDETIDAYHAQAQLATAKATRAAAVASITVEVDGMVFDGDEVAQERMARTVTAATATGASMDDTTVWVLHDNTVATPTIRQLATALRMAGEAQTALWTKPYEA